MTPGPEDERKTHALEGYMPITPGEPKKIQGGYRPTTSAHGKAPKGGSGAVKPRS